MMTLLGFVLCAGSYDLCVSVWNDLVLHVYSIYMEWNFNKNQTKSKEKETIRNTIGFNIMLYLIYYSYISLCCIAKKHACEHTHTFQWFFPSKIHCIAVLFHSTHEILSLVGSNLPLATSKTYHMHNTFFINLLAIQSNSLLGSLQRIRLVLSLPVWPTNSHDQTEFDEASARKRKKRIIITY